jgi:ADP-dependent NAD(P)H-hydrate dehydratase / NAD(P)H-hydrate epimerase
MPLLLTAAQMRAIDKAAIDAGVPGLVLMENAGRGVVDFIVRERNVVGREVAVVAGAGQNGGDGFVVARHLANRGATVRLLLAAPRAKTTGDARVFLDAAERTHGVVISDMSAAALSDVWRSALARCEVVVDAIFGTGLRADVTGVAAAAIAAINTSGAFVVAVDLPSGLDGDSGAVRGMAATADLTVTMGAPKQGLWIDEKAPVGRIAVADLGVKIENFRAAASAIGPLAELLSADTVMPLLPRHRPGGHKGTRGHALVIAGSAGKTGAACLAGLGALRAGAGLVTIATTASAQAALDAKVLELMTAIYTEKPEADAGSAMRLMALSARMKAAAIGPGIPTGPAMGDVVKGLARELPLPLVIDADGLNFLGTEAGQVLKGAVGPRVLTPHPGEMARLCGSSVAAIAADRVGVSRRLAVATGAVVVLKGARTIIAAPTGELFVNPTADPALGTAGSGDVLTGIITGFLCQGCSALDAARTGVFVHGLAAGEARSELGTSLLTAGDLPLAAARVIERLHHAQDEGTAKKR